jgi:hypothetical protein
VDERVASDRQLGQVVAAAGLGASGERGSYPDSGQGDQTHEGEGEDGDDLRTNWRVSQHGLFLALQNLGRCGPAVMTPLVSRFRRNFLFARNSAIA